MLRDYEFVQLARREGRVRFGFRSLTKKLSCDSNLCQGECCKHHNSVVYSAYHPEELRTKAIPVDAVGLIDKTGRVKETNGFCALIPFCQKYPHIVPTDCRLFPLGFTEDGVLVLKRYAWMHPCPAYGKGEPIYKSMRKYLIEVFGEQIYNGIVNTIEEEIHAGRITLQKSLWSK